MKMVLSHKIRHFLYFLARGRSSGVKGKKGGREREKRKGEIKNGKWSDPSGVKEIMKLTGK